MKLQRYERLEGYLHLLSCFFFLLCLKNDSSSPAASRSNFLLTCSTLEATVRAEVSLDAEQLSDLNWWRARTLILQRGCGVPLSSSRRCSAVESTLHPDNLCVSMSVARVRLLSEWFIYITWGFLTIHQSTRKILIESQRIVTALIQNTVQRVMEQMSGNCTSMIHNSAHLYNQITFSIYVLMKWVLFKVFFLLTLIDTTHLLCPTFL